MAPFFTIVIPTRNRSEFARQSVRRALEQSFTDFEILVLENSERPELSLEMFGDMRVRVLPSDRVLSMPDNWERGLDYVRGEYLLYISDKDMLLPHALAEIKEAIDRLGTRLVSYRKSSYDHGGNLRMHKCTGQAIVYPAGPVLRTWFNTIRHHHNAPMIYNSAVRRDLVYSLRHEHGRFFVGNAPDVSSGLSLLAKNGEFAVLDRVGSLAWFGPWSIGQSYEARGGHQGAGAKFQEEFGEDPRLKAGLTRTMSGVIVETLLACKGAFPHLFTEYNINWQRYVTNSLTEMKKFKDKGIDISADRRLLCSGVGRLYPRRALVLGYLSELINYDYLQQRSALRFLLPPHPRLHRLTRKALERVKGLFGFGPRDNGALTKHQSEPSMAAIPVDSYLSYLYPPYLPPRPVQDMEEAFQTILEISGYTPPFGSQTTQVFAENTSL